MELIVFIALIPFTKTPQNLNHSKFIYFRLALTVDFSRTTQSRLIDGSFILCHLLNVSIVLFTQNNKETGLRYGYLSTS